MRYERIVNEVFRKPWAILPEKLRVISELVALRASGKVLTEDEIRERIQADGSISAAARMSAGDYGVASVIPIYGIIQQRANLMSNFSGGTSVEKLTKSFRGALADPAVKVIIFDVDSPGGGVEGIPELADEIYKSRGQKKTIAVANAMAASAAYWIASAASELVVIPSGQVGSIGVFVAHEDVSAALEREGVKISLIKAGKFKTDGNPYEPLSDSAREDLQAKVDGFYEMFIKSVAKSRGVSQASVRDGFGQGRLAMADDALKMKMVDRIATFDDTTARVGGSTPARRIGAAESSSEIQASELGECQCNCDSCEMGRCAECSNAECQDPDCFGCPQQAQAKAKSSAPKSIPLEILERELDLI